MAVRVEKLCKDLKVSSFIWKRLTPGSRSLRKDFFDKSSAWQVGYPALHLYQQFLGLLWVVKSFGAKNVEIFFGDYRNTTSTSQ